MRRYAAAVVATLGAIAVVALLGLAAHGQPADANATLRFAAIDVFIESAEPFAAWQFELGERNGAMTVVGVENGDSAAFATAPYYDLVAVQQGAADRIVVADFSLNADASLPVGSTRIATVHVRLIGAQAPDYELRLIAAGDAEGRPIDAAIRLSAQ
jgi:hypothetical protein